LKKYTVYLAGPITGLNHDEAVDWRKIVTDELRPIHCLSPMRGKEYLRGMASLPHRSEDLAQIGNVMSTARGIMTRDRWDAARCDVLFVNLLGATRVSIGTVMEIAWADLRRTPIVCAMEDDNMHRHGMIDEAVGFRVPTLAEACDVVRSLLDIPTDPAAMDWQEVPEIRFPPNGELVGFSGERSL